MEVDESALTGESDLVLKLTGENVLSGSFCVTGETTVEATGVGEGSFANKLTKDAREFKLEQTPLQREVNRLLRVILLIVLFLSILVVTGLFVLDLPANIFLQIMAVIAGSVSAGLLTLITLNYSWGSVRIGQQGGLVQQINAIESLSNVTVLCTDKTGTLTANKIKYHDVYPVGDIEKPELGATAGRLCRQRRDDQQDQRGHHRGAAGRQTQPPAMMCPSRRRASGRLWPSMIPEPVTGHPLRGVYVLGALEMLQDHLATDGDERCRAAS